MQIDTTDEQPDSGTRILPLMSDPGNHRMLIEWLDDHPTYESVDATGGIEESVFDVCVLDKGAFQEHLDQLRAKKKEAAPVLLPYLLLLPEADSDIIDSDAGQLADNVVTDMIDEIVGLPIKQAELHWRVTALLRLRNQSLTLREREQELERQVDLFEKAQDIANVGAWEYYIGAEHGWWTEEARRIHALPEDTTVSPELSLQYYHPDDRPVIEEAFEKAVEEGEPYDLELRLIDAKENQRWVRTRAEPQYEDGELTRVRGTIQDITERKERERDLQRIKQAVEAAGHSIYITDTNGTIEYVNPAFEEVTGYTQSEAVGETPKILDAGKMSDDYFEELWDTILAGDAWKEEIINRRKNGEIYTARQTIAPVTEGGDIHAFVAIQEDITERILRRERLARRTQAIDDAPIGITISDPDQEDNPLIYVNDAFEELTGYTREEVLGENCRFLQGENTDSDRVARMRQAIDAKEPITIELKNYRKDGSEFWNHLDIAPVRDDAGEVVNYIGFQQDVSGRKERQRQLGIIDRALRHNLRNSINLIQGHAQTIQSETSGEIAASAEQIADESDELLDIGEKERQITELLQEEPTQMEFDIADSLDDIASSLGSRYPEAEIAIDCAEEVTVKVSSRFRQAIRELMTNAIVHNDSSSPEVTVNVMQTDERVRIGISDTGPAIPEIEKELLAVETEPTPLEHASGFGLWLVKLIVTRSGGTLTIEENSPVGNLVRIDLPRST